MDGSDEEFAESKQRVRASRFDKGVIQEETLFYLNGKTQQHTIASSPGTVMRTDYYDDGTTKEEGHYTLARMPHGGTGWGSLRPDGVLKAFHENGQLAESVTYEDGNRQGEAKVWYANGKLAEESQYKNDTVTATKRWDKDGKLVVDDEYYEDGSRKPDAARSKPRINL